MQLVIDPQGTAHCVYGEEIELHALGNLAITRGSHVEPNDIGKWHADLSPVYGPVLGPFQRRSDALAAEIEWLNRNWILICR
jgi:hypothetical protein